MKTTSPTTSPTTNPTSYLSSLPAFAVMLLAAFAFSGTAHAATLTWDADNGTAGVQDGDGNWHDISLGGTPGVATNWTSDGGVSNTDFGTDVGGADSAIFGSGAGGTVTMQSDVRTFGGGITFNDAYTIDTNGLQLGGQGGNITSNASGVNISGSGNYNLFTATTITTSGGNDITFSAQVTGSHSLLKTGNGTMILSNDSNNFGDGTVNTGLQINAGTVQLTSIADTGTASAAGDGGFVALGGAATLQFNAGAAGDSTDRELRLEGGAGNNTINNQSGGTVTFTGDVVNGLTTGTLTSTGNTDSITEIQGVLADNGANPLNIRTTLQNELILSGDNTFTGDLTANNTAVITIGGAGQLGSGSYAGTIDLNQNADFQYSSSADQLISGDIIGASTGNAVDVNGTGTLRLTGNNDVDGTSRVSSGTLLINGDSLASTGSILVNGGILGGTGDHGGTAEVRFSGKLAPGDGGIGDITFNELIYSSTINIDGSFLFDLANPGSSDLVTVNTFEIGTDFDLDSFSFTDLSAPGSRIGVGDYTLIDYTTFTGLTTFGSDVFTDSLFGYASATLIDNGSAIVLSVSAVPEPSSTALLGLGGLALVLRRRR